MRSSNSEKLRAASVAEMLRLPFAWDRRSRLCVLSPLSRCIFLRLVRLIKSDYLILCEIVKLTNPRHLCAAQDGGVYPEQSRKTQGMRGVSKGPFLLLEISRILEVLKCVHEIQSPGQGTLEL